MMQVVVALIPGCCWARNLTCVSPVYPGVLWIQISSRYKQPTQLKHQVILCTVLHNWQSKYQLSISCILNKGAGRISDVLAPTLWVVAQLFVLFACRDSVPGQYIFAIFICIIFKVNYRTMTQSNPFTFCFIISQIYSKHYPQYSNAHWVFLHFRDLSVNSYPIMGLFNFNKFLCHSLLVVLYTKEAVL